MKRSEAGSGKGARHRTTHSKAKKVAGKGKPGGRWVRIGKPVVMEGSAFGFAPSDTREPAARHDPLTEIVVVQGYFDEITGLSTITDKSASISKPKGKAPDQAVDVVVVGRHVFQLKPSALKQLRNYSEDEIHALVVPKRTLARRVADQEPLSVEETDKAVRLARVDEQAARIFGDAAKAHRWLRKPKAALAGKTPLAYLATEAGARVVEEMLNQIDHGIFA